MQFYYVKDDYIEFLRKYDNKVPENKGEHRPYVGIVFQINETKYYAPFTSPKPKHLTMKDNLDFIKIKGGEYGAINLNNMIPILDEALIEFDISKEPDIKYRNLLNNQLKFIRHSSIKIQLKASKLHNLLFSNPCELKSHQISIKNRCCDICLLETIYKNYTLFSNETMLK